MTVLRSLLLATLTLSVVSCATTPPPPARTSILALSASILGNGRDMASDDPVFLITGASTGIGA